MRKLKEDGEGASVTQASAVDGGKVDVFGTQQQDENWYEQLLELKDFNKELVTEDKTQYAGRVGSLIDSFEDYVEAEDYFSGKERNFFQKLIDELKQLPIDKNVSIVKTETGWKFIMSIDITTK